MAGPRVIAYFCMEFGLHEEFPIYSGGLGILAGDVLKAAGDLRLPMVGIGLRWAQGYCTQKIGPDGTPYEEYPPYDASFLQDTRVRVRVRILQKEVEARVLRMDRYGAVPLFLLEPMRREDQWITRRLYDPAPDCRVAQEILLGVGGVRALQRLGYDVEVYHFNEGHAVFGGVELIADRMEWGQEFEEAWAEVRRKIVFSTHTPVRAGNEEHALSDLRRLEASSDLLDAEMARIGGDPFNMTMAGLRLSRNANAVAKLHARTSKRMWAHVGGAAPIEAVTNGVHVPTWQDPSIRRAGRDPKALWAAHVELKRRLLESVEASNGVKLRPDAMTIGFARRAAPYKRSDLILRDPERIGPLLASGRVQILFSGKAHPADQRGKAIIRNLVRMVREFPKSLVFLENYHMGIARLLVHGCDVWLNNPVRPMEASGTSGMKAALNGVLNVSILDGWWDEACEDGVNGWKIGDGVEAKSEEEAAEVEEHDRKGLHDVLERQVLPAFEKDRDRWGRMMAASIGMAETKFSAERMVKDYFEKLYRPAGAPAEPAGTRR